MLTSEQITEMQARLVTYESYVETYEHIEDKYGTCRLSLSKAIEDLRALIDHIENTQAVTKAQSTDFISPSQYAAEVVARERKQRENKP